MAVASDCVGLQAEFYTAEANSELERERTGDGNADLMSYTSKQRWSRRAATTDAAAVCASLHSAV
jgi:hypothetical protein